MASGRCIGLALHALGLRMRAEAQAAARRILVVSAGFDPAVNEMSAVWQQLIDTRNIEVCVIAPGADALKGRSHAAGSTRQGRLAVHWLDHPFPLQCDATVAAVADAFGPDTVFAGPRDHLDCATAIAARTGAQAALHVEYFFDDRHWLRRREYAGINALRSLVGARTRQRALASTQRVFVSDPREQARFAADTRLAYLPWPHRPPGSASVPGGSEGSGAAIVPRAARRTDELLYIGSLFRAKGAARLAAYFRAAFCALPTLRLRLIGPAIDADGEAAIATLRDAAGDRFSWTPSVPRDEALVLLSRSFCVLSPGESHGWGQIGDAWHLRTPVIAACEHYDLQADRNCLIAPDADAFVKAIQALRSDAALCDRLADGGTASVQAHTVQRAADAIASGLGLDTQGANTLSGSVTR